MADIREKQTLVEEGTQFKGSLTSTCPVQVRGKVDGEIEAPSLTISETGSVHGKAKIGAVVSMGQIAGEIDADTVQLSGSVLDDTMIRARSLEVKLATEEGKMTVVFGNAKLSVGGEP
ncbi:MAG: polymer-forming cytoskeletal protein [Polyangiaceae bacterium]|nr:polymer-forming cytoskeletal protein [Polyangiaceae bacterium]